MEVFIAAQPTLFFFRYISWSFVHDRNDTTVALFTGGERGEHEHGVGGGTRHSAAFHSQGETVTRQSLDSKTMSRYKVWRCSFLPIVRIY